MAEDRRVDDTPIENTVQDTVPHPTPEATVSPQEPPAAGKAVGDKVVRQGTAERIIAERTAMLAVQKPRSAKGEEAGEGEDVPKSEDTAMGEDAAKADAAVTPPPAKDGKTPRPARDRKGDAKGKDAKSKETKGGDAKSDDAKDKKPDAARQRRGQKPSADPEKQRLAKEEKARAARRRNRQLIGLALAILIVVGAVSIVSGGVNLVRTMLNNDDEKAEYQSRFEPLVWFDILPFESVSQVDENSIKQVAIWAVVNERSDTLERNDYGEPLIPASDVDQYGVRLFGPDFRFSGHDSFYDASQGLEYRFDKETNRYAVPVTSLQPMYLATVVDIEREAGGIRRVVVGYVSTRTSDDQMIATPDYDHPVRYMDFMLRRDGSEYYLYAILNNTTHTVQQPASDSTGQAGTQPDSLPEESLPVVVPEVAPEPASVPDEDAPEDSSTTGEEDAEASSQAEE